LLGHGPQLGRSHKGQLDARRPRAPGRFDRRACGLFGRLPVRLAGFVALLPALDGCFDFCTGCCAVFFFAVEEAVPAGLAVEPPEDCPVTGNATIKKESRPARQREARRETEVGEDVTLISSL
jgi:hypothetical protein